jgi:hypothetical protein
MKRKHYDKNAIKREINIYIYCLYLIVMKLDSWTLFIPYFYYCIKHFSNAIFKFISNFFLIQKNIFNNILIKF